jgi:hypothetical protein
MCRYPVGLGAKRVRTVIERSLGERAVKRFAAIPSL